MIGATVLPLSQFPVTPVPEGSVITDQWSVVLHGIGQTIASVVWMILAWRAMRAHERAAKSSGPPGPPPIAPGESGSSTR